MYLAFRISSAGVATQPSADRTGVSLVQLQMPLSIWLASTPEEKDAFFLQAGFDPNVSVQDNGTNLDFVRFRQEDPVVAPVVPVVPIVTKVVMEAGDDTRDFQTLTGDNPLTDEFGNPIVNASVAGVAIQIAGRALKLILGGGGGRLTAAIWTSLPNLVKLTLTQAGIGIGMLIAFNGDIPFITLPGQGGNGSAIEVPEVPVIGAAHQIHMQHAQIVGSWNTNPKHPEDGVTFYRLLGGQLAVQNKKGRWKVWKPKSPIVLYASGASNLKTMLRADRALNKQAKKIAAMLNRRAPKSRRSSKKDTPGIIVQGGGRVIDT